MFLKLSRRAVACVLDHLAVLEEQGNAPYRTNCNDYIYDSANDCGRATEQKRYKVKLENPHEAPVDSAYDKQKQCDFIKHSFHSPFDFAQTILILRLEIFFPSSQKLYMLSHKFIKQIGFAVNFKNSLAKSF